MESNSKCCQDCRFYEERTHFCRLNPPTPVVFYDSENNKNKVSSKFPTIVKPETDYCSVFEPVQPTSNS